jgi:hypothetical protein
MRNGKVAAWPSGFPDWLKVRIGAGEEEGELMTWLKGLFGAQAPFQPFWSSSVKPGQTWSSLVKPGQSENRGLAVKPGQGYEIS